MKSKLILSLSAICAITSLAFANGFVTADTHTKTKTSGTVTHTAAKVNGVCPSYYCSVTATHFNTTPNSDAYTCYYTHAHP